MASFMVLASLVLVGLFAQGHTTTASAEAINAQICRELPGGCNDSTKVTIKFQDQSHGPDSRTYNCYYVSVDGVLLTVRQFDQTDDPNSPVVNGIVPGEKRCDPFLPIYTSAHEHQITIRRLNAGGQHTVRITRALPAVFETLPFSANTQIFGFFVNRTQPAPTTILATTLVPNPSPTSLVGLSHIVKNQIDDNIQTTGTVTFNVDGTDVCTANYLATCTYNFTPGDHQIIARYSGDRNNQPSV